MCSAINKKKEIDTVNYNFRTEEHPLPMSVSLSEIDKLFEDVEFHSHGYFQFYYVKYGRAFHYTEEKNYTMVRGDFFIIPPGYAHKVYVKKGEKAQVVFINFNIDAICDMSSESVSENIDFKYIKNLLTQKEKLKTKNSVSYKMRGEIESQIDRILEDIKDEETKFLVIRSRVLTLLAQLDFDINNSNPENKNYSKNNDFALIKKSIEYIDSNYKKDIKFDDVIKISLFSATHFRKLFKEYTGKTFSKYLINLRINKAIELITNSDLSITEICYESGFNDVSHFLRTYKKYTGFSPGEYRKISIDKHI